MCKPGLEPIDCKSSLFLLCQVPISTASFSLFVLGEKLNIKALSSQLTVRVAVGLHLGECHHEGVNPVLEIVSKVLHCVRKSSALSIIQILSGTSKLLTIFAKLTSGSWINVI